MAKEILWDKRERWLQTTICDGPLWRHQLFTNQHMSQPFYQIFFSQKICAYLLKVNSQFWHRCNILTLQQVFYALKKCPSSCNNQNLSCFCTKCSCSISCQKCAESWQLCDDSAGVWGWRCQRRVLGGRPFCQMIDGGTHGDPHSERLSRPLLCFHFFVFVSRVRPSNLSL